MIYLLANKETTRNFVVSKTKSYFKNNYFNVYKKKKLKKELSIQFMGKSKSNPEIYILDFLTPGRVVINAKDFRKELLQIDILKLEELSGIVF